MMYTNVLIIYHSFLVILYLSECPDSIYTLILRKGGLCGKNGVMKLASHLLLKIIDKNIKK